MRLNKFRWLMLRAKEGDAPPPSGGDTPPSDPGATPPAGDGGAPSSEGEPPTSSGEAPAGGGAPTALSSPPASGDTPPPAEGDGEKPWFASLPENWREQVAGEDEAKLNMLKRIGSGEDFLNVFFNAQDKIRKGMVQAGLPEDATEEQVKEYRTANNIPETPDGYELNLADGLVLGDEDKKAFGSVFEAAHKANVPAPVMNELVNSFLQSQAEAGEREQEQHRLDAQEAVSTLRERWGGDYNANTNLVQGLLNQMFPAEVSELVMQARLPNGKMLFNTPEALLGLANIARTVNPAATLVPNDGNQVKNLHSRIAEIDDIMKNEPDKYWSSQQMQEEYRNLLEARDTLASRGVQ